MNRRLLIKKDILPYARKLARKGYDVQLLNDPNYGWSGLISGVDSEEIGEFDDSAGAERFINELPDIGGRGDIETMQMNGMQANRKKRLNVVTGRGAQFQASELTIDVREPKRPEKGGQPAPWQSIQSHVILLRTPVQKLVNEIISSGYTIETEAGVLRVRLSRKVTASDFVKCLIDAYKLIDTPDDVITKKVRTQAFGKQHQKLGAQFVKYLLKGQRAKADALVEKAPEVTKMGSISLLTETSKMGCYSFNLPAGPGFQGGSCPSSQLGFMFQTEDEISKAQKSMSYPGEVSINSFICNGCYAIKGCYGNPSMVFVMAFRLAITQDLLAKGEFAEVMTEAIQLGREKSRRRIAKSNAAAPWGIPHPDFFRIHDAGDMYSAQYAEAWFQVCRNLPDVNFWAPTRMWSMKKQSNVAFAAGIPKNLALRPSSLHFAQDAPPVKRAATSGATLHGKKLPLISAGSGSGQQVPRGAWRCPAYDREQDYGGARAAGWEGRKSKMGGTCALAHGPDSTARSGRSKDEQAWPKGVGCRACWLHKKTPIFYQEH